MDVSLSDGFDEDDLRPITRVMYATALIPGGKSMSTLVLGYLDTLLCSVEWDSMCAYRSILAFRSGYLGPEPKTIP